MAAIYDTDASVAGTVGVHHPAMSWRSTIAGLLVSLFVFGILLSLGVALGGVSLTGGFNLRDSGIVGGIWLLLSILFSLFAGSYFSARVSNFFSPWVGMAQGAVLASLFVGVILWQFVGFATWLTRSATNLVGSAAQVGAQIAPSAQNAASSMGIGVNEIIEDNLADVEFKRDPTTVMTGVASRILRGNQEGAKRYLAANTNLTVAEVDQRINQVQSQLNKSGEDARIAAASALKYTGWTLFAVMSLSLIVSVAAGVMGALANREEPAIRATLPGFRPVQSPMHT